MKRSDLNNTLNSYLKANNINVEEVTLTNTCFSILCATKEIVDEVCNLFKVSDSFEIEHLNSDFDKNETWFNKYFVNIPLIINRS